MYFVLGWEEKCLKGISEIKRPHPSQAQWYKIVNLSYTNRVPTRVPKISLRFIPRCSAILALQLWSKWAWLLLLLLVDFGVVHVMLVLLACRMQEFWGQVVSTCISEEGLIGQARILWDDNMYSYGNEAKVAMEMSGNWRCRDEEPSAKKSWILWVNPAQERCSVGSKQEGHRHGPPKILQNSHLSTSCALDARHGATGLNICPGKFGLSFDPIFFYLLIYPFCKGNICPVILYLGNVKLEFDFYSGSWLRRDFHFDFWKILLRFWRRDYCIFRCPKDSCIILGGIIY